VRRDHALFASYADSEGRIDRDGVVERFLPLARQLAARYSGPSDPFDDIYQVACLALVKAVDRYDPGRGVAFSSYAVPTMVGEIKRYFRDRTWAVHVPRDLLEAALAVERQSEDLLTRLGRQPTVTEIADRLGMTEEEVLEAREAGRARRTTSMEERRGPAGDDDTATLADRLGSAEDGFERAEQRATLEQLVQCLSERDREVLRLRFQEDLTQVEIGMRMGISQMHVSRLLRSAVDRLRTVALHEPR
jgi:RNA polymerase sigma-B factor